MSAPALVVLDMIGTSVRADDAVPRAFTVALAGEGIALTPEALHAVRGATKRLALRTLLAGYADAETRADRAYARFRTELLQMFTAQAASPVAGADEVLARCRATGVKVALNTGFDRELTANLLAPLGWRERVDAVICGDDVAAGRPAPYLIFRAMEATGVMSVGSVANVGDTELDLAAGANAGVRWNIGVWSGAHDRATLARAPHTHLCASIADLPALLGLG
jgi:phosphonatase-like hydrolase